MAVVSSILASTGLFAQPSTPAGNVSVMVNATVTTSPARINLMWPSRILTDSIQIYRKVRSESSWIKQIVISTADTSTTWVDDDVVVNVLYEYKIVRYRPNDVGTGYIASGIRVTPDVLIGNSDHYMGKLILIVQDNIYNNLPAELATLRNDLMADGWVVIEHDLSGTETVGDVHALIVADYNTDASHVKAVYLLGHVPVPYSGNMAPDGHSQHEGAWPCDGYYGDVNGTWTDNTVSNTTSDNYRNHNVPGDGSFDQNLFPGAVELQVGRVDLNELDNAFDWTGLPEKLQLNEAERMQLYLNQAHAFKVKQFVPNSTGIVFNNFVDYELAANGYRNIGALVGYTTADCTDLTPLQNYSCAVTPLDDFAFGNYISGVDVLWSYACGGGTWSCASDVSSTDAFARGYVDMNSVFNMSFGSYFGDWNTDGNFLRSPLVKGHALTNVWAGVPNWWFHTMGMGEPIGRGVLMTMNNQGGSPLYTPQSGDGNTANWTQTALMGDPTLRMVMVAPPSNMQVTNVSNKAAFSWTASPDISAGSGNGYNVYAFDVDKKPVRLNTSLITGTNFTSTANYKATGQYMVRAVKLHTSKTGTYWNLSLGAMSGMTPVSVKVFLGGPFNSGSGAMNDALRQNNQVPAAEPYSNLGNGFDSVGGGDENCDPSVFAVTGSNAIVDWVLLELRSSSTLEVVASQCALVQCDGDVVGTDGTSPVKFNLTSGSYHVSIRHRNHLGCMTSSAIAFNGTTVSVDFTSTSTSTWGTDAQKTIGSVHVLWPANAHFADFVVKYTGADNDRDAILNRIGGSVPSATVTDVYTVEDVNMDNVVKYTGSGNDRDVIFQTIGSSNPTNTRTEQLP